ncbi:MAG: hypothetical protein Q4C60_02595 [Eubacteriales bacterium]|nr:hypothetical protein [Eubacteriales bacterium]
MRRDLTNGSGTERGRGDGAELRADGPVQGSVAEQGSAAGRADGPVQGRASNTPRFRRCVIAFGATAAFLLAATAALTAYVDPFFHYHEPLENFPYVVDNQLSQNPGMAEHMEYDSVILGSSMTVNFNTNWFAELMGLQTIKLSYSGAFPKDIDNIAKIVFDGSHEVRRAFLAVDVPTYTGGVDETKYPLPTYLYDDNPFNDVQYLLNKDVFLEYVLRPVVNRDPTDLATVYASWWTPEYYSEEWVMRNYTPSEYVEQETEADAYLEPTRKNLETNILPYIEENPGTTFTLFFPPYSVLFWYDVQQENHLEATLAEYRYLMEQLLDYDNVEVFFFPDDEEIVSDLNNYADYSHYSPEISRYLAECFADGTGKITETEEIGEHIDRLRTIALTYDYEGLMEKWR